LGYCKPMKPNKECARFGQMRFVLRDPAFSMSAQ
jgi:hypothetical protein